MNEITLIETNGKTLLFVEVPEDARAFEIVTNQDHPYNKQVQFEVDLFWGLQNYDYVNLPTGSWKIMGLSTELSEEQMKEICEEVSSFGKTYWKDYKSENSFCEGFSVQKSYLSLLEANGIVDGIKDPEPELDDYCFAGSRMTDEWGLNEYQKDFKQWQEAQSKVKHYLVLERI